MEPARYHVHSMYEEVLQVIIIQWSRPSKMSFFWLHNISSVSPEGQDQLDCHDPFLHIKHQIQLRINLYIHDVDTRDTLKGVKITWYAAGFIVGPQMLTAQWNLDQNSAKSKFPYWTKIRGYCASSFTNSCKCGPWLWNQLQGSPVPSMENLEQEILASPMGIPSNLWWAKITSRSISISPPTYVIIDSSWRNNDHPVSSDLPAQLKARALAWPGVALAFEILGKPWPKPGQSQGLAWPQDGC